MMSPRGYGQVNEANNQAGQKKKKVAAFGVSTLVLLAVVGTVATVVIRRNGSSSSSSPDPSSGNLQSSVKAIDSICQPTDYQQQCKDSLSKEAGNTTDPKELVQASFKVTIDRIKDAFDHSETLQAAEKDPRTSKALENCKELFNSATEDLRNSMNRLGGLDITKIDQIVDDLKVWLSAVVTYQETCLDGFENTTGDAAESMKNALASSTELTSNALAIIDDIGSVLTSFKLPFLSRRLLSTEEGSEGFPSWVNNEKRKLLDSSSPIKPNVVVAQDGSGDCKTIKDALARVPKNSNQTFVIYIKAGVYKEQVEVPRSAANLMMYGDGQTKSKITGNLNFIDGTPTFKSATFAVIGDGFMARDLGIENSAGAEKHQAVALRVQSDKSVFYNCQLDGYQDTLYAHTKRQFYRDCTVTGTIDFIFGDAASFFQNCHFVVRKPMDNQQTIVTAHGRKDRREATGIVLHNCTISADPAYVPFTSTLKAYLGRPWKEYSRTVIMQSQIESLIHPDGWLPWMGDFALRTCFYTEFDNRGPGSGKDNRVKWDGIKQIDYNRALKYSVETFIQGNDWLKATGVPYIPGLLPLSDESRIH